MQLPCCLGILKSDIIVACNDNANLGERNFKFWGPPKLGWGQTVPKIINHVVLALIQPHGQLMQNGLKVYELYQVDCLFKLGSEFVFGNLRDIE